MVLLIMRILAILVMSNLNFFLVWVILLNEENKLTCTSSLGAAMHFLVTSWHCFLTFSSLSLQTFISLPVLFGMCAGLLPSQPPIFWSAWGLVGFVQCSGKETKPYDQLDQPESLTCWITNSKYCEYYTLWAVYEQFADWNWFAQNFYWTASNRKRTCKNCSLFMNCIHE